MPLRLKIANLVLLVILGILLYLAWNDNQGLHDEIKEFTDNYGPLFDDTDEKASFFELMSYLILTVLAALLVLNVLARTNHKNKEEDPSSFIIEEEEEEEPAEVKETLEEWVTKQTSNWKDLTPQKLLSTLVELTNAGAGLMYIKKGSKLTCKASYAYSDHEETYELGQGIPGQVANPNNTIVLDSIPEDYLLEGSGLGTVKPEAVVVIPVRKKGKVTGVVELALLNMWSEETQQKCEQLAFVGGDYLSNEKK